MTDIFEMTTFVSIYQAGEGIYEQFDKVLVIDQGRQVRVSTWNTLEINADSVSPFVFVLPNAEYEYLP